MKKLQLSYADGTNGSQVDSVSIGLADVASRYGVAQDTLVTSENDERTLIWLDGESARNDDGKNAIAVID